MTASNTSGRHRGRAAARHRFAADVPDIELADYQRAVRWSCATR